MRRVCTSTHSCLFLIRCKQILMNKWINKQDKRKRNMLQLQCSVNIFRLFVACFSSSELLSKRFVLHTVPTLKIAQYKKNKKSLLCQRSSKDTNVRNMPVLYNSSESLCFKWWFAVFFLWIVFLMGSQAMHPALSVCSQTLRL